LNAELLQEVAIFEFVFIHGLSVLASVTHMVVRAIHIHSSLEVSGGYIHGRIYTRLEIRARMSTMLFYIDFRTRMGCSMLWAMSAAPQVTSPAIRSPANKAAPPWRQPNHRQQSGQQNRTEQERSESTQETTQEEVTANKPQEQEQIAARGVEPSRFRR